jgi:hypothetical protein
MIQGKMIVIKPQNTKANQTNMPSIEGSRQSEKHPTFHETFKIPASIGPNPLKTSISSDYQS